MVKSDLPLATTPKGPKTMNLAQDIREIYHTLWPATWAWSSRPWVPVQRASAPAAPEPAPACGPRQKVSEPAGATSGFFLDRYVY